MTREEAIKVIKEHIDTYIVCHGEEDTVAVSIDNVDVEAFDMAIKALEQKPCGDAVSRQAVIDTLTKTSGIRGDALKALYDLPPVTPQQKMGNWFIDERPESDREVVCSNCDQPIFKYHKLDFDYRPKYCPNCGAKMQEVKDADSD